MIIVCVCIRIYVGLGNENIIRRLLNFILKKRLKIYVKYEIFIIILNVINKFIIYSYMLFGFW